MELLRDDLFSESERCEYTGETSAISITVSDCYKKTYHMRTTNQKTFIYNGKHFVTEPVRTDPYVWHLTRKRHRLNIALEGILPIRGLVFANNVNESIGPMWHWDTEMECHDGDHLDYWRIDVRKAGVRWYIDSNMAYEREWGRYVCTPSPIPVHAITLFRHDESLKFTPSKYDEYGEERDWVSQAYAVKDLKSEYEKLFVKKMDGVASCSLRHLPLKRVDPIALLAKDIAEDNANEKLAFFELPKLFEEHPEQTLAAINMEDFESFFETLFKNRKIIGWKENWNKLFWALRVNEPHMHRGCREGRFHQASLYNEQQNNYAGADIFITIPFENFKDYRFFRMEWDSVLNGYRMEEYLCGSYQSRTHLEFSGGFYCPDALNKFLLENPKTT